MPTLCVQAADPEHIGQSGGLCLKETKIARSFECSPATDLHQQDVAVHSRSRFGRTEVNHGECPRVPYRDPTMEIEDCDPVQGADREGELSADSTVFRLGVGAAVSLPSAHHDANCADSSIFDPTSEALEDDAELTVVKDVVARSLSDLIDDWHRKGHNLSYDDVTRVSTKRDLDGMQLAKLLEGLWRAGIELTGIENAESATQTPATADDVDREAIGSSADRDALGAYLREIGQHPLIFAEDEVRLGRLIKAGLDADLELAAARSHGEPNLEAALYKASKAGRRAHAELVLSNLRLVVSIARKYLGSGMDMLDLIQEGNLGLLHAADLFDYSLGYKFSTYATWWIRQAVTRGIANQSRMIRLPVHFHDRLIKVLRARQKLSERLDHEPALADLAGYLDMDPGEVQAVLDWAKPTVSLDTLIGEDGDVTLGDLLAVGVDIDGRTDPQNIVLTVARQRDITKIIRAVLDDRSMYIICRRFGLDNCEEETLETIGKRLGVTRERVRQLETKAMKLLAGSPTTRELYEYLVDQTNQTKVQPANGWPEPENKRPRKSSGKVASEGGMK